MPLAPAASRIVAKRSLRPRYPMRLLTVHQITKTFHAGSAGCRAHAEALRGVDLVAGEGEIVGVIGEPGAGKTTLLLCAAGLLRPDAGHIDWPRAGSGAIRDVAHARYLRSAGRGEDDCVAIAPFAGVPPAVLLVDDAFSGVSPSARVGLVAILRRIATLGSAVVVSARERPDLRGLGARLVRLHAGRMVPAQGRGAPPRTLELLVASPVAASRLLRAQLGGVERHGDRLKVPLQARTPEEVLAQCSALRITVNASRVVHAGAC